eukprot:scaffold700_cov18-Prasinocladus_malaysianus.AAC.1
MGMDARVSLLEGCADFDEGGTLPCRIGVGAGQEGGGRSPQRSSEPCRPRKLAWYTSPLY